MTRESTAARNPTGNTVPSAIGTSPKISPGCRSPSTRTTPSTSLVGSMRPSSTANSARSAPSGAAYSPATRLTSAAKRETCSRCASSSAANSGTAPISSGVTTGWPVSWPDQSVSKVGAEELLQPVERLRPTVPVQLAPRLSPERALAQAGLRRSAEVPERQLDQRLDVVGIRRLPSEGMGEAAGRVDLAELAGQVEGIALGRLHLDPVAAPDARVVVEARHAEARRSPPPCQLVRVRESVEHDRRRRRQDPLDVKRERHSMTSDWCGGLKARWLVSRNGGVTSHDQG